MDDQVLNILKEFDVEKPNKLGCDVTAIVKAMAIKYRWHRKEGWKLKHGKRLTRMQKKLLRDNRYNDYNYLAERDLTEGTMFVDRLRTHRLFYDKSNRAFSKLKV